MATIDSAGTARADFFKQLKSICVPLSRLALRSSDGTADAKEVQQLIERLTTVWECQASRDPSVLDEKLADYVFFPVSHVLRNQDKYPMLLIEASIKLLHVLIRHGWKGKISKELSQQLLVFLTFVIGGVPGKERNRPVPEETLLVGYRALGALMTATGSSTSASAFFEDHMVPSLGHSISVILDGITDGVTPDIQLAALGCLEAAYASIKDRALLATFLPGTVSLLSRALSPPLSRRTQKRVLVKGLSVLRMVLCQILGDIRVRAILKSMAPSQPEGQDTTDDKVPPKEVLTPAWLKATASQVKIALSAVLKLRNDESEVVQTAVRRLCIGLLDECHSSLENCKSILVESAMVAEKEEAKKTVYDTSLEDLVGIYPELGGEIRSILYNWATGLPRVMQSSEEKDKQRAVRNLIRGSKLAATLEIDSATLEDTLADALKDSIVALILGSRPPKIVADPDLDEGASLVQSDAMPQKYQPVILADDSQHNTRTEIQSLVEQIGSPSQKTKLANELLSYLQDWNGVDQISSYWLSFQLIKAAYASEDVDEFLNLGSSPESQSQDTVFQQLYEFSASVLAAHSDSDEVDWRVEAIAMEVTAFAASRMRVDFRPELIDVLYPITTFMGSQNAQLRRHSMTTLNNIAAFCGYGNVTELIISNVDYMVNSVSLKLNTLDISPASTRVLTMMIRLTGPKLIPFLDDVVVAIFAALDNYHGYPLFVESLFAVLSEVVLQGVRSDRLLLQDRPTKRIDRRKRPPASEGMDGILKILDERSKRRKRENTEQKEVEEHMHGHPKKPWGPPKTKPKSFLEALDEPESAEGADEDLKPSEIEESKLAATPTYNLLARVTTLTQHYLTSPTPSLRKSLLHLLTTVFPALALNEDTFLPIVNALWPVLLARLRDQEPFVAVAACQTLGMLCQAAGDFLSTRVKTEWPNWMGKWFIRVRDEARKVATRGRDGGVTPGRAKALQYIGTGSMGGLLPGNPLSRSPADQIVLPLRGSESECDGLQLVQNSSTTLVAEPASKGSVELGGLGRFAQAAQVWKAAVGFLTALVSHVQVDDTIFDQMLDLVAADGLLTRDEELRRAFDAVNADAVWLVLYERGEIRCGKTPRMNGVEFASVELIN
ncbi:hypothetical protein VTK73DRAFT_902 [Phialemonium thermophilum]|uniref:TEL2-interacting protein 1 n=1 Tax=Phialemonium thermophilum TaxID=223376 RepID=A0ABR3Y4P8_9PEZI